MSYEKFLFQHFKIQFNPSEARIRQELDFQDLGGLENQTIKMRMQRNLIKMVKNHKTVRR